MIEENKIALFDAYRNQDLSDSEVKLFEKRLETESLFKLEYEEYLSIVQGIREFERQRLKQFLMEAEPKEQVTKVVEMKSKSAIRWIKIISAAAAVILLMIGTFNFFTFENRITNRHQIDLIGDNTMGEVNDESRKVFYEGLKLKEENIDLAISKFKTVKPIDINAYFLAQYEIAILEIKKGNIPKAKDRLVEIINRKENHFVKTKSQNLLQDLNSSKFW